MEADKTFPELLKRGGERERQNAPVYPDYNLAVVSGLNTLSAYFQTVNSSNSTKNS